MNNCGEVARAGLSGKQSGGARVDGNHGSIGTQRLTGSQQGAHVPVTPRAQAQVLRGNHFGYVIDRVLGDGAWSRVYQVLEPRTSRVLALKHVVSASEREARYLQQAEMEWEVSRRVKSPVIRNILHRASRQTTVGTDVV